MAVIELAAATVRRAHPETHERRIVMGPLDLRVEAGEHWVVLGPNGAGKTSMLLLAAAVEHPYSGTVTVLGGRLGRVDLRVVRERIGFVQGRLVDEYEAWTSVLDVLLGGATGTILVRDALLTTADRERALVLLERFGCAGREHQRFASLSEGERRRVLVARSLMNEPPLLLLDEPTASLDLPGRETVIGALERLAADEPDARDGDGRPPRRGHSRLRHARAPPARGRERGAGADRDGADPGDAERRLRPADRAPPPRQAARRDRDYFFLATFASGAGAVSVMVFLPSFQSSATRSGPFVFLSLSVVVRALIEPLLRIFAPLRSWMLLLSL